jgi:glycerol-3-phosphate O-acyltransferase
MGKVEFPNDKTLDYAALGFLENQHELGIQDLKIVPITINYERVFEGESFPLELTGEGRVKESLTRFFNSIQKNRNESYGRVRVKVCDHISLNQFIKDHRAANFKEVKPNEDLSLAQKMKTLDNLKLELAYTFSENTVIMPTAIVATILLMHRKGIS